MSVDAIPTLERQITMVTAWLRQPTQSSPAVLPAFLYKPLDTLTENSLRELAGECLDALRSPISKVAVYLPFVYMVLLHLHWKEAVRYARGEGAAPLYIKDLVQLGIEESEALARSIASVETPLRGEQEERIQDVLSRAAYDAMALRQMLRSQDEEIAGLRLTISKLQAEVSSLKQVTAVMDASPRRKPANRRL